LILIDYPNSDPNPNGSSLLRAIRAASGSLPTSSTGCSFFCLGFRVARVRH